MTPRDFLDLLWKGKPEALYLLIWTLQGKRSHWFREIAPAADFVEKAGAVDTYVGVGLSAEDFGVSRRCPSDRVAGVVGLWADIDFKSEAHSKKPLPTTVGEALSIIPTQFPPTIVVATGNGCHVWWLLREPWIFQSPDEQCRARRLVLRWQTVLALNSSSHGWAFDRLADLARVLRIPGTLNNKEPNNRKPIQIHSQSDRRYERAEFENYLDALAVPDPEEQARTASLQAASSTEIDLVIDPNAAIPGDLLQRLLTDPRFRDTWSRKRPDLADQSQSGFDMAIANHGCEAHLSDQQIVDLIIHHRRIHGQRPRNRLDYFRRTLSKARNRLAGSVAPLIESVNADERAAEQLSGNATNALQPDPAYTKALLCERLSQLLGVRILRILKITGTSPTYHLELENATLELASVDKLIGQSSLRKVIAAGVDLLISRMKPKDWDQVAQMLLQAATPTEGGEETGLRGPIKLYLDHYLSDAGCFDSVQELPMRTSRQPTIIDSRIAILVSDLQLYINKTFSQNLSTKTLASMLTAVGGVNKSIKTAKFRDQSRWLLPAGDFDPQYYLAPGQEA